MALAGFGYHLLSPGGGFLVGVIPLAGLLIPPGAELLQPVLELVGSLADDVFFGPGRHQFLGLGSHLPAGVIPLPCFSIPPTSKFFQMVFDFKGVSTNDVLFLFLGHAVFLLQKTVVLTLCEPIDQGLLPAIQL